MLYLSAIQALRLFCHPERTRYAMTALGLDVVGLSTTDGKALAARDWTPGELATVRAAWRSGEALPTDIGYALPTRDIGYARPLDPESLPTLRAKRRDDKGHKRPAMAVDLARILTTDEVSGNFPPIGTVLPEDSRLESSGRYVTLTPGCAADLAALGAILGRAEPEPSGWAWTIGLLGGRLTANHYAPGDPEVVVSLPESSPQWSDVPEAALSSWRGAYLARVGKACEVAGLDVSAVYWPVRATDPLVVKAREGRLDPDEPDRAGTALWTFLVMPVNSETGPERFKALRARK
jgi:hypothetical protein